VVVKDLHKFQVSFLSTDKQNSASAVRVRAGEIQYKSKRSETKSRHITPNFPGQINPFFCKLNCGLQTILCQWGARERFNEKVKW
jgi:hypothetical protein